MSGLIKVLVILFYGLRIGKSTRLCPNICSSLYGNISCSLKSKKIDCSENLVSGTVVHFKCNEFYLLEGEFYVTCLTNGSWSSELPKCKPDCGREGSAISLIVNGEISPRGVFPWHVAVYNKLHGKYEFWCSGSLISEFSVITAAHCTWKIVPGELYLAFGKFYQDFDAEENYVQKIKASRIELLDTYQDASGNYNGDISVIFLENAVNFTNVIRPICLDLNQTLMEDHLKNGNSGIVLGWGLTENDTSSEVLRILRIPVTSNEQCIAEQEPDFKKYITYTSFCAGFANGTGVCNGDSGGGLAFSDASTGRWYIQGIISVSPRRKGTPYCDLNFRTVFTKVGMFSKWLRKVKKIEANMTKNMYEFSICQPSHVNQHKDGIMIKGWNTKISEDFYSFLNKYFGARPILKANGKIYLFPHSEKILQSAEIFKKGKNITFVSSFGDL